MAESQQEQAQAGESFSPDEFSSLLEKEFRPKSDRAKSEVEDAVSALANQIMADSDAIISGEE